MLVSISKETILCSEKLNSSHTVGCKVWSVESKVSSAECGVWSVKRGVQSVGFRVWIAGVEVRSAKMRRGM